MTPPGITDPSLAARIEPAPDAARLELFAPETDHPTTLDGAWWPHSQDLAAELPLLVTSLAARGMRVTRVIYHPDTWQLAPPKIRVGAHVIHLGWFREIDPHLLGLRTSDDKRVEVLVIPPDTDAGTAARAMILATTHRNLLSPTAVLDQAHGAESLAADPEVTT